MDDMGAWMTWAGTSTQLFLFDRLMPETGHQVVVHHARGLHVRVDDGRSHELEAALLEVLAQCVRYRRGRGYVVQFFPAVLDGRAFHKPPQVRIEAAEFFLHR